MSTERIRQHIHRWSEELIDFSRRNRLLHFRPTRSSTLEILNHRPDQILSRLPESGNRAWRFYLPPEPEPDEEETRFAQPVPLSPPPPQADELATNKETRQEVESALRLLQRKTNQEFLDKGLWVLYLGVGMLRWIDPDTQEASESPIILVPVKLDRANPRSPFELRRAEEEVVINPALVAKLGKLGVNLAIDTDELDNGGIEQLLERVENSIREQADWRVVSRIILGTFSFHKEVMYRDLLDNEAQIAQHAMVGVLALGPDTDANFTFDRVPDEELDEYEGAKPEQLVSIVDADSTQRRCILAAREGRTFVMDGPPGTGKSQTISNIIAELIALGKSVLFVSEKAAALDVVHKRLDAAGLSEYLLQLHSHKATRKEVAQELGRSLTAHPRPGTLLSDADMQQLQDRRTELSNYARATNVVRPGLARTLHDVLGRIASLHRLPEAPVPSAVGGDLRAEHLSTLLSLATDLANAWGPIERADEFVWRDLREMEWDASRRNEVAIQLNEAASAFDRLRSVHVDAAKELGIPGRGSIQSARNTLELLEHLLGRPSAVVPSWLTADSIEPVIGRIETLSKSTNEHRLIVGKLSEVVGPRWRELAPDWADHARGLTAEFESSPIPWTLPEEADTSHLVAIARLLEDTRELAELASRELPLIGQTFRLTISGASFSRAAEIAELSALSATVARPEPGWFDPEVLPAVQRGVDELSELVSNFRQKRSELSQTFTEGILRLDLEGIRKRFETTHRGLRKLSRTYRDDKRLLRQYTRTGKVNKGVIARLPHACAWLGIAQSLTEAEKTHLPLVGTNYYRRTDTDFTHLRTAIGVAQRALAIAGKELNGVALEQQLALGRAPDLDLVARAERLHRSFLDWRNRAGSLMGEQVNSVLRARLEDVAAWSRALVKPADDLADLLRRVSAVATRDLVLGSAVETLNNRRLIRDLETQLELERPRDQATLGGGYEGLETDWDVLREDVVWAARTRELTGGSLDEETAEGLINSNLTPDELRERLSIWEKGRSALASNFADTRAEELVRDLEVSYADGASLIYTLQSSLGDVDEWAAFVRAQRELGQSGLEPVAWFCIEQRVSREAVVGIFERSLLEAWADAIIRSDQRLKRFRREDRQQILEEFRQLDRRLIQSAANRVIQAANSRRPRTTVGEPGVIQHQSQLRRRHMPVRVLLEKAGNAVKDLKPCFMMSPLTVSQFLPPALRFDCVVFDEASQVRPSDAINCIYRGDQLIVAGDQKQLPPTSFFEKVDLDGEDEYEEGQFDEYESVLDLAKSAGAITSLPLRWHYRSQHERLITYSNYSFYEGGLVTFPGRTDAAPDVGIELFKVGGIYRRGGARDNPIEASEVCKRVLLHAERHPDLSLGVVTFSESQAGAIEDELEQQRRERPDLDHYFAEDRLTGFFVKSLEHVQGDERDIIIFSVGYGFDEVRKFTLNFGPLNREKGWRRLNVAITRARRRVEIVSSITANDIKGEIKAAGVRHLKHYLDFAERGIVALALDLKDSQGDVESPFEAEVLRVIREWGFDAVPQIGTSGYRIDIGVRDPNDVSRYILGVECDGVMYHTSAVARDRDRLREEVLQRLGWKLHRIWGVAWYRDREGEERRLRGAIEAAMNDGGPVPGIAPASSQPESDLDEIDLQARPDWAVLYRVCRPELTPRFRRIPMNDTMAVPEIERMVREVVALEGPVADEVVLSRLRLAWRAGRAGARMRDMFRTAVARLARKSEISVDQGFLAVPGSQVAAVRVPDPGDPNSFRKIDELPDEEIELAIVYVTREARSVTHAELTRHVARIFGWQRRGTDIAQRLDRSVKRLIRQGRLASSADRIEWRPS